MFRRNNIAPPDFHFHAVKFAILLLLRENILSQSLSRIARKLSIHSASVPWRKLSRMLVIALVFGLALTAFVGGTKSHAFGFL